MDIEFAGTHDDFTTLRADLFTLGYTIGELVGTYSCDCWGLTRQGKHFHAQIAVTAPKTPAPDPAPDMLLDDIAERMAQAAGVRVDVTHAGQHSTGEPPPWSWLGLPSGCAPAVGDAIARLDGLTMPQPGPRPRRRHEPEPPSDITVADPDGRRDAALKALGNGPNGDYVVIQTRDQRRITLARTEVEELDAAGIPLEVLFPLTRDGLLVALGDADAPPGAALQAWENSDLEIAKVTPRDGHPTDPDVTVVLADRTRATLTASQWATLHIAGVNPPSLTAAELADALGVNDPDMAEGR